MPITPEQYANMLLRQGSKLREPHREAPVEREAELHEFVRQECERRGWIGYHGSMAHRTHRTIGEPDWIIIADRGRVFQLELKGKLTKVTPSQLALKAWAEKLGTPIHIFRSKEEILTLFDS